MCNTQEIIFEPVGVNVKLKNIHNNRHILLSSRLGRVCHDIVHRQRREVWGGYTVQTGIDWDFLSNLKGIIETHSYKKKTAVMVMGDINIDAYSIAQ